MHHLFSLKKSFLFAFLIFFGCTLSFSKFDNHNTSVTNSKHNIYNQLQLSKHGLSLEVFTKALAGWKALSKYECIEKSNILSIADLSQSSNSKRLYIIDMDQNQLLFNTYVAHGRNSGEEFACSFSNSADSYKSSLGFYLTGDTYEGLHGLSLKLKGVEKGINDIAEQRGIVIHGASYVSESFCIQNGRLGRSLGCPAVPEELCQPIINAIKGGSCLFMFYPDSNYFRKSVFL